MRERKEKFDILPRHLQSIDGAAMKGEHKDEKKRLQEKLYIAKKLLERGTDLATIAELTDLSQAAMQMLICDVEEKK